MSSVDTSTPSTATTGAGTVDTKLEVVVIPVADVDRAKEFYERLGWRLDADVVLDELRLIQMTPPGSGCSVHFGRNITGATPGSARGMHLVVSEIDAARDDLTARGIEATSVFHEATIGARFHDAGRVAGPSPDRSSYSSFVSFADPDGNTWLLQEITTRLPGRVDSGETTFSSAVDVAAALRRAAAAHGEHEARTGEEDPNWPDWYAAYIVAEQAGADLPL